MPYKDPEKQKQRRKERYWENREEAMRKSREYYWKNREQVSKKAKEYYKENKERIKKRVREYEKNHKEECNERGKRWRENNPEKRRVIIRRYYIKKKMEDPEHFNRKAMRIYYLDVEKSRKRLREYRRRNPVKARYWKYKRRERCDFSVVDKEHMTREFEKGVLEKLKKQNYKCVYCGKNIRDDYSIDHIVPLSKGGTNEIENIDLVCKPCNTRKGTRSKEEYMRICQLNIAL